jgi:hypothetical protein
VASRNVASWREDNLELICRLIVALNVTKRADDKIVFQGPGERAGANTMTAQDEKQWRALCNEAMSENDPNKLLSIFLALDRAMNKEERLAYAPLHSEANK